MKNPLRTALFRALAPDDAGGGGAPAASEPVDFDALADAAYDTANDGHYPDLHDERGAPEDEDAEADADESDFDGVPPDDGLASIPDEVVEQYPMVGHLRTLDEGLSDPGTAAETLRAFAHGVAQHHGLDLAEMLGIAPAHEAHEPNDWDADEEHDAYDAALAGEKPWWEAGFDSPEAYEDAPEYERAGFTSEGEYRLAQRLDALQSQVAPALQAQQEAARIAHYEALVGHATPHVVQAVRAETGWTPSAEQVMHAARTHPHIAAHSLPQAVQAAFFKEIVAHARGTARSARTLPDDMPLGGPRPGTRKYEPPSDGSVNWNKLADAAYEAVAAG